MLNLLTKEIRLSMHPIAPIMLLLSSMVLIPNYPYSVVYFYITLAIFFTCLLGRENNDVVYSLTLPIAKSDIVKARILFSIALQIAQMILAIPFSIISQHINVKGNAAGMDPNIAYFAIGFIIYGLFNYIFFCSYYNNVKKVGFCFIISSTVIFLLVAIEVIATHAIPFVKDHLDTKDPAYLPEKLVFLVIGLILYIALNYLAFNKSKKNFEKQDI